MRSLELAVEAGPTDAVLRNDLSAALLRRGEAAQDPEDFALAYDSACQALELEPRSSEALFNRAQALTLLQLRSFATDAWITVVQQERDSIWRERAERLRDEVAAVDRAFGTLALDEATFRESLRGQQFDDAERMFRAEPRVALPSIGVDLLPAAAAAHLARPGGVSSRVVSRLVAAVAARWHAPEEAAALALLETQPTELARAHLAFGRSLDLLEERRPKEATTGLRDAEQTFGRFGSPYWARARTRLAAAHFLLGEVDRARAQLDHVIRRGRGGDLLLAEARQLRALIFGTALQGVDGQLEDYAAAEEIYRALGNESAIAELATRQASALALLGESRRAWPYRVRSLGALSRATSPRKAYPHLTMALAELGVLNLPAAARDLSQRSMAIAQSAGPLEATDVARERVRLAGPDLGTEVKRAEAALDAIADSDLKRRMSAEIAYAHAQRKLEQGHPARPEAALAVQIFGEYGDDYQQALALVAVARSALLESDGSAARQASTLAFEALLRHRSASRRGSANAPEWTGEALEELVEAATHDDSDTTAWDSLAKLDDLPEGTSARDDRYVLYYFGRRQQTDAWIVHGTSRTRISLAVSRAERVRLAHRYALATELGLSRERANLVRSMAAGLVDPLLARIPSLPNNLVIVPPRELHGFPLAQLFDRWDLWFANGLRHALRAPIARVDARSLVALGSPQGKGVDRFPPLPSARVEVAGVARVYPESRLFVGSAATHSALLEAVHPGVVVHVATHGISNESRPERSYFVLAPESSTSGVEWTAGQREWERIAQASLLVLSVCSGTSSSARLSGAPTGLASAALQAGVPYVVATVAPTPDDLTAQLMIRFHRNLTAGATAAAALRAAQAETVPTIPRDGALDVWSFRAYL